MSNFFGSFWTPYRGPTYYCKIRCYKWTFYNQNALCQKNCLQDRLMNYLEPKKYFCSSFGNNFVPCGQTILSHKLFDFSIQPSARLNFSKSKTFFRLHKSVITAFKLKKQGLKWFRNTFEALLLHLERGWWFIFWYSKHFENRAKPSFDHMEQAYVWNDEIWEWLHILLRYMYV